MKRDKAYLKHIIDVILNIGKFIEGVSKEEFLRNVEKQYAVLRGLEIIGEASKNLSNDLKRKHKKIPWREIAGMRDKLIHEYFGVNLELVWKTVKDELPQLKVQVSKIIHEIETPEE